METVNPITSARKEVQVYYKWLFEISRYDIREYGVVGRFKIQLNLWYFDAMFGDEIAAIEEYVDQTCNQFFEEEPDFDKDNIEHITYQVVNDQLRSLFESFDSNDHVDFSDIQKIKCVVGTSKDPVSVEHLCPFAEYKLP